MMSIDIGTNFSVSFLFFSVFDGGDFEKHQPSITKQILITLQQLDNNACDCTILIFVLFFKESFVKYTSSKPDPVKLKNNFLFFSDIWKIQCFFIIW